METMLFVVIVMLAIGIAVVLVLFFRKNGELSALREKHKPLLSISEEVEALERRRSGLDKEIEEQKKKLESEVSAEIAQLEQQRERLNTEITEKRKGWETEMEQTIDEITSVTQQLDALRETADLQSFGIYEPHFEFDTPEKYKIAVKANREKQKQLIKDTGAAICDTEWTVEGSRTKGRQMTKRQLKLMLRAFNGECDAAISKARFNNVVTLEERIGRSFTAINKLGKSNQCRVTETYKRLKIDELRLAYELAQKKENEKQEQRQIRAQMREEEKARKEIEKAKREAEKEEQRFQQALEKARVELQSAQDAKHDSLKKKIHLLEEQFREAHDRKEKAIARARLTKSGHIYVISNVGSFGEDIFKIGMTRRMEPLDRVKELGDASVPFPFDIHAMIYSDDAPSFESQLHERFKSRQVNLVNHRKEFFAVELERVKAAVEEISPEVQFITTAVAEQYRESLAIRKKQELEEQKIQERKQAVEVAAAKDKFQKLKQSWKAEPIG